MMQNTMTAAQMIQADLQTSAVYRRISTPNLCSSTWRLVQMGLYSGASLIWRSLPG